MSLATRLCAFFLAALALVLLGFSTALFFAARTYLTGELDERLDRALDTLEASVDIEPGGLEWEPADRRMVLGVDRGETAVRWVVRDGQGKFVDVSGNSRDEHFPGSWAPPHWPTEPGDRTIFGALPGWRLAARRLDLDELLSQGRGHPNDEPGYEVPYSTLILIAGLKPRPVQATLRSLGIALAAISAGIWTAAAGVGRRLCVSALAPVRQMARAATAMTEADLSQRLPAPETHDELDDLGRAFNDLLGRLEHAFSRLHDAYDKQRQFAGDASHQLRTPIAGLLSQVQVCLRRDRPAEEYRRVLEKVQSEGIRLHKIVESLLLLARPEHATDEAGLIELEGWLHNHIDSWSAHPRAADLKVESISGPICVRGHAPLLAQIVDNLLDNAFNCSKPGAPVFIRLAAEGLLAVIEVEDRGWGLTRDELEQIFEPFFRAEAARLGGQPGVGLGLAIARRIAAVLGGTLTATSTPGSGSRFVLRLPIVPD